MSLFNLRNVGVLRSWRQTTWIQKSSKFPERMIRKYLVNAPRSGRRILTLRSEILAVRKLREDIEAEIAAEKRGANTSQLHSEIQDLEQKMLVRRGVKINDL